MTSQEIQNRKFHIQKTIYEIQEILRIIKPGRDKIAYENRVKDYQKQLLIFEYFENQEF